MQNWTARKQNEIVDAFRHVMARSADGRYLGGILTIDDGDIVFARNGAYRSDEARELRLGNALLWHTMASASARGCKSFHWGITWTGNTGLLR